MEPHPRIGLCLLAVLSLLGNRALGERGDYLPVRDRASIDDEEETLFARDAAPDENYALSLGIGQTIGLGSSTTTTTTAADPSKQVMLPPGGMDLMPLARPQPGMPPEIPGQAAPPATTGNTTNLTVGGALMVTRECTLSVGMNGQLPSSSSRTTDGANGLLGAAISLRPLSALRLSFSTNVTLGTSLLQPMPLGLSAVTTGMPQAAADQPPDQTTFQAGAEIALWPELSLVGIIPWGTDNGVSDPSLGARASGTLLSRRGERLAVNAGVFLSPTLSSVGQREGKLFTVTGSINPAYQNGAFRMGLTSSVTYASFPDQTQRGVPRPSPGSAPPPQNNPGGPPPGGGPPPPRSATPSNSSALDSTTQMPGMPVPQSFGTTSSLSIGARFSPRLGVTSGFAIGYAERIDGSVGWATQATALAVNYSPSALSLTASLGFNSDAAALEQARLPTRPSVYFGIRYVLGNPVALAPDAGADVNQTQRRRP